MAETKITLDTNDLRSLLLGFLADVFGNLDDDEREEMVDEWMAENDDLLSEYIPEEVQDEDL